jgi:hypothetical protein
MRSNATPSPDGLNAAFYKATWSWSKQDVHNLVSTFYTTASLPTKLNQTFITLIPKKPNPIIPQDFRPISLCNVIYKIISKSLADRLKPHLPASISQTQSAFIAGRHISSNVILTQEIIHSFMLKSWTPHAFLLKIDLAKAFDRLEWSFITQSVQRLGFNSHFIQLIYTCISSSSLSILVNQQPTSYFYPQRGLRQGCPLSPYLFVIAINELSLRLQEQMTISNLQGVSLAPGAPTIHSLLFADDLILCGTATMEEVAVIKNVLYNFCTQSGQTPNLNKSSILFSHNVPTYIKDQITAIFPVAILLPNTMHLGHPMIFSHKDKNRAYNFIYSKFSTLKANKLNHAGRLQYITSVLSSIPVYYMSTVLFSKTFINKIISINRKFWWIGVQAENPTNPLHFHSWDDISKPKAQGGLGIRDMELINKSLLIQTAWNIVTDKNPFLSNILKAKYYPNSSFWTNPTSGPKSVFWSSVLQIKHHLNEHSIIQIYAGNSSIWSSPWMSSWSNIHDHILLPVTNSPLPTKISDLWLQGTTEWNQDLLSTTFSQRMVQQITSTPIVQFHLNDILRWQPATNGLCTSKSIYKTLQLQQPHSLPATGSRALTSHTQTILTKIWKAKTMPPLLKTFAWRLFRNAIPTADRVSRFATHIDKHCTTCGVI